VLKKPVFLEDNYFQGKPLPQKIVNVINEKIGKYYLNAPLDYNTLSFMISDLMYEGWMHQYENWREYFIVYEICDVNGDPFVFKNTHPSPEELDAFYGNLIEEYKRFIHIGICDNCILYVLKCILARYFLGDIFDCYFLGSCDNLPNDVSYCMDKEAKRIYVDLWNNYIISKKQ